MTTTPSLWNRRVLAASLGVAAVALTGCGSAAPGVAATVGDETISQSEVEDAATGLCAAYEEGLLGQPGGPVPMDNVRSAALQRLTLAAQARQIADEAGVEPGTEYERQLADLERSAETAGLDEREVQGYLATDGGEALAIAVRDRAGEEQLIEQGSEDPTVEESSLAGQQIFGEWYDDHEVAFDPRYGVAQMDGQLVPTDTSLSVAVSDTAQQAGADQPDPEYVASLPSSQRCG